MANADILLRLNAALDGLSAALISGDPQEVLAAEVPLATAVQALASLDTSISHPTPELALELLNTRLAVERCVALGRTGADLLAIVAGASSYGPAGRPLPGRRASATVEARS